MRIKWVDIANYIGPDRRKKRSARWSERRGDNLVSDLPPLDTLLRRLRVHVLGLKPGDDRASTIAMAEAAATDADRLNMPQCAAALRSAEHALRNDAPVETIDAAVSEAMDHASAER
jgi:hypothetical protein